MSYDLFRLVPQSSLSTAEELEEVAALSCTQELSMLRNKALDVKCDILQTVSDFFQQSAFCVLK